MANTSSKLPGDYASPQAGILLHIARKSSSRAPMEVLRSAEITPLLGIAGDYRGSSKTRQVTVLSQEAWKTACEELGVELPWIERRANLLIDGIDLADTTGQRIRIGETILTITGETKPCERMDEACMGLREKLIPSWRGGVTCKIIQGGQIRVGEQVFLESD